jgi:hypothetical protein
MPNPSRHIPRIARDKSHTKPRFTGAAHQGRINTRKASRAAHHPTLKGDPMLKTIAPATLCLAILAGCKTEVDLTLFTSDVMLAAKDGTALDATATISLEAASEEKCAEAKDAMAKALGSGFSKVEFVACRPDSFETWADFRVALPILPPKTESDRALYLWTGTSAEGFTVVLRQNESTVQAIIAALPDDMRGLVQGTIETAISLTLQNDMTEAVTVAGQGVFIDGAPYQLPHKVTLARRAETKITLSDVGNAAIHSGSSLLFTIKSP